jgi:hypothetical protein
MKHASVVPAGSADWGALAPSAFWTRTRHRRLPTRHERVSILSSQPPQARARAHIAGSGSSGSAQVSGCTPSLPRTPTGDGRTAAACGGAPR